MDRVIDLPLPTERLASFAMQALQVDKELSTLVRRSFSVIPPVTAAANGSAEENVKSILRTEYRATTNRMLRVAVNGFMESLAVVLEVMEQLDVDVIDQATSG
jgi:EKC/KEOPS complex subunit PCC1/LAGE3